MLLQIVDASLLASLKDEIVSEPSNINAWLQIETFVSPLAI
jgi:hypothetical protein